VAAVSWPVEPQGCLSFLTPLVTQILDHRNESLDIFDVDRVFVIFAIDDDCDKVLAVPKDEAAS